MSPSPHRILFFSCYTSTRESGGGSPAARATTARVAGAGASARQAAHLDQHQGAPDERLRPARALGGVVLGEGVQAGPGAHAHPAILLILDAVLGRGGQPGGRVGAGELVAMTAGPTGGGSCRGIGISVEAAVLAQAHQGRDAGCAQGERRLHGVIAGIEDKEGHRTVRWQAVHQRGDLRRRHALGVRAGMDALRLQRCRPTIVAQAELVDPLVGLARHDELAGRVARGVVRGGSSSRAGGWSRRRSAPRR